jgi:hypothetical protein
LHDAIEEIPAVGNVIYHGGVMPGDVSSQTAVYWRIQRLRNFGIAAVAIMGVLEGACAVAPLTAGGAALLNVKGVGELLKYADADMKNGSLVGRPLMPLW